MHLLLSVASRVGARGHGNGGRRRASGVAMPRTRQCLNSGYSRRCGRYLEEMNLPSLLSLRDSGGYSYRGGHRDGRDDRLEWASVSKDSENSRSR
jgi:hypothetical protein